MSNSKKVLGGIILVAVLAIGGYLVWNTKAKTVAEPVITKADETANWKTYTNAKYGFELKYPETWATVNYDNGAPGFGIAFQSKIDGSGFKIVTDENLSPSQTIKQYLQDGDARSQTAYEGSPSKDIISSKYTFVSNLPAIQREEFWNAAGFKTIITYVKNGTTIYYLQLQPQVNLDAKYTEENQETYNQILSTFKFTK